MEPALYTNLTLMEPALSINLTLTLMGPPLSIGLFENAQQGKIRPEAFLGPGSGLGLGLEEVFVFDSKRENRDRAVEAVESVSEARAV